MSGGSVGVGNRFSVCEMECLKDGKTICVFLDDMGAPQ